MTSTITKHKRDYAKYVPTYDYSQVNNWSMSKEESNAILDEATRLYEAGDREGYYKMLKNCPSPQIWRCVCGMKKARKPLWPKDGTSPTPR